MLGDHCESHNLRTESFEGAGYPANTYCDFDLDSGLFAWVNETSQHLTSEYVLTQSQELYDYEIEKMTDCTE